MKNSPQIKAGIANQIAFLKAAQDGDIETLALLSKNDASLLQTTLTDEIIEAAARKGTTLWTDKFSPGCNGLHYAADNRNINAVKFLIGLGLHVDSVDSGGFTPLDYAVDTKKYINCENFQEVAKFLLDKGAKINFKATSTGDTVLHTAVKNPEIQENVVTFLLNQGADITSKNLEGNTALHLALFKPNVYHSFQGEDIPYDFGYKFQTAKKLIDLIALNNSDPKKALININEANNNGDTVMHFVARILSHYYSCHKRNSASPGRGGIPQNPTMEIEKILTKLKESGADISIKNNQGNTALDIVKSYGKPPPKIVSLLGGKTFTAPIAKSENSINSFNGEGLALLHVACQNNDISEVERLLNLKEVNINLADKKNKDTALHHAIRKGNFEIVEKLLLKGANPLIANNNGDYSIHIACSIKNNDENNDAPIKVLRALLGKVSSDLVNEKDGMSPLQIASANGSPLRIEILLNKGAQINLKNTINGNTALHYAARNGKEKAVDFLIEKGAESFKNRNGNDPASIAREAGFNNIAKLLSSSEASTQHKGTPSAIIPSAVPLPLPPSAVLVQPVPPTVATQPQTPAQNTNPSLTSGVVYMPSSQTNLTLPSNPQNQNQETPNSNPAGCFSCIRILADRIFGSNNTPRQ